MNLTFLILIKNRRRNIIEYAQFSKKDMKQTFKIETILLCGDFNLQLYSAFETDIVQLSNCHTVKFKCKR